MTSVVLVTSGRAGHAARLAPEAPPCVDRWHFTPTGEPVAVYSVALLDVGHLQLVMTARMPVAPAPPVRFGVTEAFLNVALHVERDVAREITRHLMRQAAHGQIPMPPRTVTDRLIWSAAVDINASFIERFGLIDAAESER
jgi:hypothetical protein